MRVSLRLEERLETADRCEGSENRLLNVRESNECGGTSALYATGRLERKARVASSKAVRSKLAVRRPPFGRGREECCKWPQKIYNSN